MMLEVGDNFEPGHVKAGALEKETHQMSASAFRGRAGKMLFGVNGTRERDFPRNLHGDRTAKYSKTGLSDQRAREKSERIFVNCEGQMQAHPNGVYHMQLASGRIDHIIFQDPMPTSSHFGQYIQA
jgi:hypothetical protein